MYYTRFLCVSKIKFYGEEKEYEKTKRNFVNSFNYYNNCGNNTSGSSNFDTF